MRLIRLVVCSKTYAELRDLPRAHNSEWNFGGQLERLKPAAGDVLHIRELDSFGQRTGNELPRRIETVIGEGFVTLVLVPPTLAFQIRSQLYHEPTKDFEAIEIREGPISARELIQAEINRLKKNRSDCLIPPLVALQSALGDVQLNSETERFMRWFLTNDFDAHKCLAILIHDVRSDENAKAENELSGAGAARRMFADKAVPA